MPVGCVLTGGAQTFVFVGFHDAESGHADTDQRGGKKLHGNDLADAAGDQTQHGDDRAGGIADGRRNGKLDIAQAEVADRHGRNVEE